MFLFENKLIILSGIKLYLYVAFFLIFPPHFFSREQKLFLFLINIKFDIDRLVWFLRAMMF